MREGFLAMVCVIGGGGTVADQQCACA